MSQHAYVREHVTLAHQPSLIGNPVVDAWILACVSKCSIRTSRAEVWGSYRERDFDVKFPPIAPVGSQFRQHDKKWTIEEQAELTQVAAELDLATACRVAKILFGAGEIPPSFLVAQRHAADDNEEDAEIAEAAEEESMEIDDLVSSYDSDAEVSDVVKDKMANWAVEVEHARIRFALFAVLKRWFEVKKCTQPPSLQELCATKIAASLIHAATTLCPDHAVQDAETKLRALIADHVGILVDPVFEVLATMIMIRDFVGFHDCDSDPGQSRCKNWRMQLLTRENPHRFKVPIWHIEEFSGEEWHNEFIGMTAWHAPYGLPEIPNGLQSFSIVHALTQLLLQKERLVGDFEETAFEFYGAHMLRHPFALEAALPGIDRLVELLQCHFSRRGDCFILRSMEGVLGSLAKMRARKEVQLTLDACVSYAVRVRRSISKKELQNFEFEFDFSCEALMHLSPSAFEHCEAVRQSSKTRPATASQMLKKQPATTQRTPARRPAAGTLVCVRKRPAAFSVAMKRKAIGAKSIVFP